MKRSFLEVFLWIWQFPQNLLGILLLAFYKREEVYHRLNGRTYYYTDEMRSGISLGNYIIMNRDDREDGMRHEYGHSIQSRILGWFYLPVIGLPSLLWNIIDWLIVEPRGGWKRSYKIYYSMPWEAWADKLGNVRRVTRF